RFDGGGAEEAVLGAAARLGDEMGVDVRTADPSRYAGVVLVDGNRGRGDATNHALGMAAPQLVFVGGSAADDWRFAHSRVFAGGEATGDGAVLVLLEMTVPFTVMKSCSFVPHTEAYTVTRADEPTRTVFELDGRPAAEVYSEVVGVPVEELGLGTFMKHPLGMVLEGDAFIRSPHSASPERGLMFQARVDEGMQLHIMRGTDLIGETRVALDGARERLGGSIGGALSFNCALRLLEMNAGGLNQDFLDLFDFPMAGFHTFGESYLVQLNHTYTGLAFA
ncbi:MAG: FIST C-terminal domain-containing protein, partial [Gemmatimonadetes bacterium]|nr:FIST C-terminal domain-containing protein [Gemmatimonadota bacterium]